MSLGSSRVNGSQNNGSVQGWTPRDVSCQPNGTVRYVLSITCSLQMHDFTLDQMFQPHCIQHPA